MKSTGYKVPEGYFDGLKGDIMATSRTMQAQVLSDEKPTVRVQLRSALTFAASFAAMVVIAITGYYFTGHKASEKELAQNIDEITMLYGVDEYDIIELNIEQTDSPMLAEASVEYLEVFGFPDMSQTEEEQ